MWGYAKTNVFRRDGYVHLNQAAQLIDAGARIHRPMRGPRAEPPGPATWHTQFPMASGTRQSPIDIRVQNCMIDGSLTALSASYSGITLTELKNVGSSWKADVGGGKSSLRGGPLSDEFILEQFHCHWGKTNETGSEHIIDGITYAAELHLVHWNKDKYKSFAEASNKEDGLTVIGVFMKIGEKHKELYKISKLLPFIKFRGQSISVIEEIQPSNFIPRNGSYFTYLGSLTTPPCFESVTWLVYEEPITISKEQIDSFRNLKSYHPCEDCPKDELHGCMYENYRPPCPLYDRSVRMYQDPRTEE